MALTEAEKTKLELFKSINLNRVQTEALIGRKLANVEWKSISKDYRKTFKPIAIQAAKTATEKNLKSRKESPEYIRAQMYATWKKKASDAKKREERRLRMKATEADDI